ncbi:MAG: hypothetical protein GFH27_549285n59 [Chloroflexi bacterium AL-W]|nr:hypothetical protein [Chloroflexi bacterium AL-N1]NOK65571.1 hypothetical protein [Chloroflexi bacterium AL-N10]NOK74488.1 hypothetical protein [Chloroflexi bacterium AL-N5]NOK80604.1 hypothetical protein [Chloroflexi bacterium AL-W]NOK88746.1 hypothetical protein [Chloroflexi bacterium AL-N15]
MESGEINMSQPYRLRRRIIDLAVCLILCGVTLTFCFFVAYIPRSATITMDSFPFMIPVTNFYSVEEFPDRVGNYRWSSGESAISLPNPGGPITVGFIMAGGPGRTVPVRLYAQDAAYELIVTPEPRTYTFVISATWEERLSVTMTAPTFEERHRRLGVVVSDIQVDGGHTISGFLVAALLTTVLGCYILPRQIGVRIRWSVVIVSLVLCLLMVWQLSSLWYYALFVPLLWFVLGMNFVVGLFNHLRTRTEGAAILPVTPSRERIFITSFGVLVAVNVSIFTSLYLLFPRIRYLLFFEDQLIESIAAMLLLGVCLSGIVMMASFWSMALQRAIASVFASASLVGFLDEVSYGQRFFGFSTWYIYDKPVDGVHDILDILRVMPASDRMWFFLLMAVMALIVSVILWKTYVYWSHMVSFVRTRDGKLMGLFLLISLVCVILSTTIDFLRLQPGWFAFAEELLEMNVTLALLFALFSVALPRRVS